MTTTGDGIDASTDVVVTDGVLTVNSGGGSGATLTADAASAKGIKGGVSVVIEGGQVGIDAADDARAFQRFGDRQRRHDSRWPAATTASMPTLDLAIKNGTVLISKSYEGIEGTTVTIDGGDITRQLQR